MYHSITFYPESTNPVDFGGAPSPSVKNTWDDWHLIPASRPAIAPPQQKTSIIDVPGSYGAIDASNALTGYPVYGLREGSFTFYVENGHENWAVLFSSIQNYLHGQFFKMILEDDASFYYQGRFTVGEWQTGQSFSGITISYSVYPFKKELVSSTEDWIWDSFNFEKDIIRDYRKLEVPAKPGKLTVNVPVRAEYIVPVITTTGACTLTYMGKTYSLANGANEDPNIVLGAPGYVIEDPSFMTTPNEYTTLVFEATTACQVTIEYRGGSL